jgi:hypothetical protein
MNMSRTTRRLTFAALLLATVLPLAPSALAAASSARRPAPPATEATAWTWIARAWRHLTGADDTGKPTGAKPSDNGGAVDPNGNPPRP